MSTAGKIALASAFCIAVLVVVALVMLGAAMGDCAAEVESECMSERARAIQFWGAPVVGLAAIFLFKWWLDRK